MSDLGNCLQKRCGPGDKALLNEGVAKPIGMPNFGKALSYEEVEAIRAYGIRRANDLKAGRAAH